MIGLNPWIKRTPLWRKYRLIEASIFFELNANRVLQITGWLFDQKSKEAFTKMIAFRQTGKRSDHIFHSNDTQYFINDFFTYGKNEVLIDCGAYTGDTIERFLEIPDMEYKRIVAFEPGTKNFELMEKKFSNNPKITLINAGVYKEDCEFYFKENSASGNVSKIPTGVKNEIIVKVKAIDNLALLEEEIVTFIKMDVEGSEMDALKGAEKTILRDKPRLAICIYHSYEDMLQIAEYIHGIVPEYKLYVRHHTPYPNRFETVLYAQIT